MPHKKSGSRVVLTDPETGESREWLQHDPDETEQKGGGKSSPTRFSTPYSTIFRPGSVLLMRDRRIRGGEHRVLHAILATAPLAEPSFPTNLEKLAAAALMSENEVGRALTRLHEVGLIERPRHGWIALNPDLLWRGGAKAREEAVREKIASGSAAEGDRYASRIIESDPEEAPDA